MFDQVETLFESDEPLEPLWVQELSLLNETSPNTERELHIEISLFRMKQLPPHIGIDIG